MKKKTLSGAAALAVLASATIPVYATPIEANSSEKKLSNPVSTANKAVDPMNVYTTFTESVTSNSGDGSAENPYNRFEDAIAQVADGGTIYIKSDKGAFLNAQDEYGHLPFLIDKNITIKPADGATNANLSVRSGGIILGADVTFENITLSFANKYHDSIFANGHTLNLINVIRGDGTRLIDVFAGGLYERKNNVDSTTPIYPIGDKGVINIETNDNFSGTKMSAFGNVYAGSMNGKFDGSAEINLSNNGQHKKLELGAIKASGALEADAGNMFDIVEPLPPSENPEQYPVMNDVTINLHNYQISVDGTTGSDAKTNVSTSTVYRSDLPLKNVNHLTVREGHIAAAYEESNEGVTTIPNVTLENGATLDLTKAGKEVSIENYDGNGITLLRKDGKLNITNSMNGSIELQTEGAFGGTSGLVEQDHVYITTPNEDANITFTPHATQKYLKLVGNKTSTVVEWKIQEAGESTGLAQINGFVIEDADAKQVKAYDEINKPNDMGGMDYEAVGFSFKVLTDLDPDNLDAWVDLNEYPFDITINGKKAEYREDENGIGTHYFVEDLELAIYFASETYFDEHDLMVMGYTKDGDLTSIKEGEYEIHVSHVKDDGTLAEFTSYLTVTNNIEPPIEDGEGDEEDSETETPPTEGVDPDAEGWLKATAFDQLNHLWNYSIDNDNKTVTLESFKGINNQSDDVKVEIPRVVEGYKVVLANLNTDTFKNVTHIRVAEGDEEYVKVLATDLSKGFKGNDVLKHVDLEGLNVSGVTDMTELFSMCRNLQVIKIKDWVIRDTTSIMGMFYASRSATNKEKKILVITNNNRIKSYDFGSSNRIPSVVTFSGEGGHFLNDEGILNMAMLRYTVETDVLEDLAELVERDKASAGVPTRAGYEFKGWYTENPTPTNVYELLDMTYKAKWEKVVEEEKPEQPEDDNTTDEGENGDTTPPTVTPQPPVNGEGSVQPPVENVPTNGIENLKDLDKELQEKVDSIIAEVVVAEGSLSLNITGDTEDIAYVKEIEVAEEGIFAIVDGKKLKFGVALDGLKLDLTDARAVRINKSNNSTVKYAAVPHQNTEKGLKVSSNNLENILITSKIAEPFVDVDDTDWFKEDVEEALNYGFTTGTTPTTYNPYADITRAQFAVMIARALELTPKDSTVELSDIEGKWYQNEAQALYEAGIIKGFNDGTFGGEKKLTRQQAATMMVNMLKYTNMDIEVTADVQFADMDKIGDHAQDAVKFLALNGVIVSGENVKFNPYGNLTRAQMAKMLVRSLRLTDLY